MRLSELVALSATVTQASARLRKIGLLADALRTLPPDDLAIAIPFLTGALRQGKIGIGAAAIRDAADMVAADVPSLSVTDVDGVFSSMAGESGAGSAGARVRHLRDLFTRATREEQQFLGRLLFGELRQGAVEGVLADAVARAADVPVERIRRAAMVSGALAPVAVAAISGGAAALQGMNIALFAPVQPMLAGAAGGIDEALGTTGAAGLEFKLDGARIQAHKLDDEVRVYSRSLRDVSAAVPDVVDLVQRLPARSLILDGEAIALRPDGTPHPFQVTMRRFGRKADAEAVRQTLPLSSLFFDCLYVDGAATLDEPFSRRVVLLDELLPEPARVPRLLGATPSEAEAFALRAEAMGHEGVMVKALDAPYAAGRRGSAWLKVKRAHTLDLVVLAAEWGSGRRTGTLSNLHLGARDEERGGFVMLGKTFKGLTDELLAWQTAGTAGPGTRAGGTRSCSCGPNWWWRSPSTRFRRVRSIRVGWRFALPASAATARTRSRRRPIRS